jgi:lysophospholipase L1-like esterase
VFIVCDGNSLTAGQGGTPYPKQLLSLLGGTYQVQNFGVGGQTTEDMIADAATQIDSNPKSVLIAWEGGNDIIVDGADLATLQSRWNTYFSARKAAGWGVGASKLVAMTITPRTVFTAPQNALVAQFNDWLRSNYTTYATHLVDLAADTRLDDPNDATYYDDGIHMTTAGYAVVAELIQAEVF